MISYILYIYLSLCIYIYLYFKIANNHFLNNGVVFYKNSFKSISRQNQDIKESSIRLGSKTPFICAYIYSLYIYISGVQ